MNQLGQILNKSIQILRLPEQPLNTARRTLNALESLKRNSTLEYHPKRIPNENERVVEFEGLDLIESKPLGNELFLKMIVMLEQNFGIQYPSGLVSMLREFIYNDGWSEERFVRTAKHFLKNQKYPNWTIADWFNYGIKVYPAMGVPMPEDVDVYIIGGEFNPNYENDRIISKTGILVWKPVDGQELPFVKIIKTKDGWIKK